MTISTKPAAPGAARSPGRPRRGSPPAVTRDAIVTAALASLTASGAAGLVLRDVARRLSVSLATIQRHFRTRDDLWRACVDHVVEHQPFTDGAAAAATVTDGVSGFLRYLVNRTTQYPFATAALWNDEGAGAAERLEYLYSRMAPVIERARARFGVVTEAGAVRPIAPEVLFALLSLGVSSLGRSQGALRELFGVDLADDVARTAFADGVADLLLFGLLPRGDAS